MRVATKVAPTSARAKSRRTASGKAWLIAGAVAVAVTAGLAVWNLVRPGDEEHVPSVDGRRTNGANPGADAGPAGART